MSAKRCFAGACLLACVVAAVAAQSRAPVSQSGTYTVLSREGRKTFAVRRLNGQDMASLGELAALFGFGVREDPLAGGLVISAQGRTIVLSPDQGLASVAGRLVSLPAPLVREGRDYLVPVEFLSLTLGSMPGSRLDLRKGSRLVIVGDLRVPRVAERYDPEGNHARLTFEIDPATPHRVVQDGRRLVITFDADALDASIDPPEPGSLATAIRAGETPAAVVVELSPGFQAFTVADLPGAAAGPARFVVELVGAAAEAAPAPPPGQLVPPPAPAPPPATIPSVPTVRTIVVDPGHGGDEDGARGAAGVREKDITLAVARRLKAAIEGRLGIRVLLTRDGDVTVSLDQRAALANTNQADLFLSLHASASPRAATAGAEVFYLGLDEYGSEAQRAVRVAGEAVPVFGGGTRQIDLILWELAQARHIDRSASLAGLVEEELSRAVPMSARAIQQAPLRVLVGANMPAVLVEMGYVTNPQEGQQLISDARQNAITQALVDSVIRFRDQVRGRPGPWPGP